MTMRIAILCNDRLALPATTALIASGLVVAVGMTAKRTETRLLVQKLCADHNIPIQLLKKNDFGRELINWLHKYQPGVVLVKTFPWKIPAAALTLPPHGFINFHYAPLPEWRGANPLFWMIRNRVSEAAVTVHRMDASYDTGPILLQLPVPLQEDMTMGVLVTQLAYRGIDATNLLLQGLAAGSLVPVPQDHVRAQWYSQPVNADLVIDWQQMPAADIKALVKACNPWSKGAATSWKGWAFGLTDVSIRAASAINTDQPAEPGIIIEMDAVNGLLITTCDGLLIKAEVMYCEEGFFPGHYLQLFGVQQYDQLGTGAVPSQVPVPDKEMLPF